MRLHRGFFSQRPVLKRVQLRSESVCVWRTIRVSASGSVLESRFCGTFPSSTKLNVATAHERSRPTVPILVFVTLDAEVHEQIFRFGGQFDRNSPVFSPQATRPTKGMKKG
ncbi:hypothetical protein TNCV_489341 [Trichonephila clavipes]|nr:hypothetical protein TNCV_489341 [Trichonephila clavipes]